MKPHTLELVIAGTVTAAMVAGQYIVWRFIIPSWQVDNAAWYWMWSNQVAAILVGFLLGTMFVRFVDRDDTELLTSPEDAGA